MTISLAGLSFLAKSPSEFWLKGYPFCISFKNRRWYLIDTDSGKWKVFGKRNEAAGYLADKMYLALGGLG